MYSVNGISLDNPSLGWLILDSTAPLTTAEVEAPALVVPGRDGSVPFRGRTIAPVIRVVVETPRSNQDALRVVFRQRGVDSASQTAPLVLREIAANREAPVELVSLTPDGYGDADAFVELAALLRIPGVYWRDVTEVTTAAVALASASVVTTALPGLTAPVRDAVIRVKGSVTGLRVTDSNGSFFTYSGVVASTDWLRFECATGRAFLTSTDVWTGGAEVTGQIGTGAGPYPLELTPYFTTDPTSRTARVTVATTARTGTPTIEIRGKRAYEV